MNFNDKIFEAFKRENLHMVFVEHEKRLSAFNMDMAENKKKLIMKRDNATHALARAKSSWRKQRRISLSAQQTYRNEKQQQEIQLKKSECVPQTPKALNKELSKQMKSLRDKTKIIIRKEIELADRYLSKKHVYESLLKQIDTLDRAKDFVIKKDGPLNDTATDLLNKMTFGQKASYLVKALIYDFAHWLSPQKQAQPKPQLTLRNPSINNSDPSDNGMGVTEMLKGLCGENAKQAIVGRVVEQDAPFALPSSSQPSIKVEIKPEANAGVNTKMPTYSSHSIN